ncbi:RagB/SusD family nutrient uptake outer membrane protein [Chitinophaga lutea]|uniref:RagB/SusD family nutrient uptake outer membrane protein n=1 Tax=Chitinophaga lutea TaxID=2488634 RepID=A0A3N4Q3F0_9BACT|nr:RagB/SusD family nutrient uptake outer membrane protein [Chitinophaga lutea]RPE11991.1 RagB/SusD family nutrient uptake outer membrane protein [Chitinophaga lutea]
MKLKIAALILIAGTFCSAGCRKFLLVEPVDKLSGNAFWKKPADVEAYVSDMYGQFRDKLSSTSFIAASGELRSGQVRMSPETDDPVRRAYIDVAGQNDLLGLIAPNAKWNTTNFNFPSMTKWKEFYRVIQSANIMEEELAKRTIPELSTGDLNRYTAEAVFIRCMTYLFLVRLYGDVPYYTEAYLSKPLPRTNMVTVIDNCIADLEKRVNDLPWNYKDPSMRAVRATKGGALAMLMYMHMWNAGFDKGKKQEHYEKTVALGKELMQSGTYKLLPIEEFHNIFKGRSQEGLLEIAQNYNYGETLSLYASFSDMLLHVPYKSGHTFSMGFFRASFLRMLYPEGEQDMRRLLWFDQYMLADNGRFMFLKFTNVYAHAGEGGNPDDNVIIFRYAGVILLTAEAMAETGRTDEAVALLNIIRDRAGAPRYIATGVDNLRQAIYIEQAKELMGEGVYYFDLVRTGRVMDQKWCYYPLSADQFERGGWTWPLSPSVMDNNPLMTLNNYWTN